jgi:hypothetical protein
VRLLRRAPVSFQGKVPSLNERQILRALRIPHLQRVDQIPERGLREAVEKAARRAASMEAFTASVRTGPVTAVTDDPKTLVTMGSSTLLRAPSLVRILGGATQIGLLAVTLGEVWDLALDELAARNEPAEAWFLDALGTAMTDLAARAAEDRIAGDMAREGLTRTRRYRPGYGDWGLEAQGEICALVAADRIGVRVNEAFALLPRKSVTGVVGFGEGEQVEADEDENDARNEPAREETKPARASWDK